MSELTNGPVIDENESSLDINQLKVTNIFLNLLPYYHSDLLNLEVDIINLSELFFQTNWITKLFLAGIR